MWIIQTPSPHFDGMRTDSRTSRLCVSARAKRRRDRCRRLGALRATRRQRQRPACTQQRSRRRQDRGYRRDKEGCQSVERPHMRRYVRSFSPTTLHRSLSYCFVLNAVPRAICSTACRGRIAHGCRARLCARLGASARAGRWTDRCVRRGAPESRLRWPLPQEAQTSRPRACLDREHRRA